MGFREFKTWKMDDFLCMDKRVLKYLEIKTFKHLFL